MFRWLLAATLLVGGCAVVSSASPDTAKKDLSVGDPPPRDTGDMAFTVRSNDDMAVPVRRNDQGVPILVTDMAQPPVAPGDMTQVACAAAQHLVINEVQVDGVSDTSDEFIEIYNPCLTADAPLAGWKLLHRSANGTSDQPIIPLQPTTTPKHVPMGGYYLVAGPAFKASAIDVQYSQAALAMAGGGLALVDASGTIVDSMAWGASSNAYVVGSSAPAPAHGQSVARIPNGSSANNDDSKDFKVAVTPTPRAMN